MSKTAILYAEAVAVLLAVAVAVHYLAGLDWPWAIVIGAAVSVMFRRLIHSAAERGWKRPLTGGR